VSDALAKARERTEGEGLVGVFVDRQEFTAMLDVIEAADYIAGWSVVPDLPGGRTLLDALHAFRDLMGDDDE